MCCTHNILKIEFYEKPARLRELIYLGSLSCQVPQTQLITHEQLIKSELTVH